jgi:hypothetical protein
VMRWCIADIKFTRETSQRWIWEISYLRSTGRFIGKQSPITNCAQQVDCVHKGRPGSFRREGRTNLNANSVPGQAELRWLWWNTARWRSESFGTSVTKGPPTGAAGLGETAVLAPKPSQILGRFEAGQALVGWGPLGRHQMGEDAEEPSESSARKASPVS